MSSHAPQEITIIGRPAGESMLLYGPDDGPSLGFLELGVPEDDV